MRVTRRALGLLLVAGMAGGGCRTGQPLVSRTPEDQDTPGTIAGTVIDAGGEAVVGRRVHAVASASGVRYGAVTAHNGGFSIPVPPGDYRLEVDLAEGERVLKDPGTIRIDESDLDANLEVVLGT